MPDPAMPTASPPRPTKTAPTLREARPDDAAAIHALLRGALRDTPADLERWRARWEWQCWENPCRAGRPVGWVMTEEGRLIGHAGAVYVPLRVRERRCLGAILSAYCVAPDAAARGGLLPGLQLAQAFFDSARATDCLPLAASANEKTGAVFARFGCRPVAWTREFYRMPAGLAAEMRACWGSRCRIIRRLQTGPLATAFTRLAGGMCSTLRQRPRIPLPSGCHLEERTGLADWAAPLGGLDEKFRSDTLGVERSAGYLAWRYDGHPERERIRLFALRHRREGLLGAAFVFRDERPDGRLAVVEEIIAPADRPVVARALLCAALRFAGDCGLDHLATMTGRWDYHPLYWELGFEMRARSAPAAVLPRSILDGQTQDGAAAAEQAVELWHGAMF